MCPNYLIDMLPGLVANRNPYHRRRPLERNISRCKTELYKKSFVPSTTLLWNSLPDNIKESDSISSLKHYLSSEDPIVPSYFYYGERKEQVMHCRLRLGLSDLRNDMFNRHLIDDPLCACGAGAETAGHYLLSCYMYDEPRTAIIFQLPPEHRTIEILLNGTNELGAKENILIFQTVHAFISESNRFL